ncbi:hypothetical protein J5N97_005695 [Dioscorea zingiberensis]|uniref:Protein kinase domain-containing protein n=1 Tax=Dioscorea zingiberensis TaxID=325984 RepID=A0A9D5DA85_9LILI|nr:hypothetical protein J5N97_005695 [Dioscorea zingiberensis]
MHTEIEEQRGKQRKSVTIQQSLTVLRPPIIEQKLKQEKGCCRSLTIIFSINSDTRSSPKPKLEQQVAELEEEVRRQTELKVAYKSRLDRMHDYLKHCLEIARENGFLNRVCDYKHSSSSLDPELIPRIATTSRDPHLAAITCQAIHNGWSIEPHEITLLEAIGKGTTAEIYRGNWRGLDVAVKWIHPQYFQSNEGGEAWFAQELDTLSRQRHPFVLRFLGACLLPPENAWVVTELLSGQSLTEWLHGCKKRGKKSLKPLPGLKQRIEKSVEIAQAMQYLHEQKPKVIHRDLKPSNILLDDAMHVRVADFGHARFLSEGEKALTGRMGTFVYMAPEVIRSEPYTEKCDVYSFGIILNELITGEHPYIETTFKPCEIASEVEQGKLRPRLPEEDEGCDRELIELISCMWDGNASARPSFKTITCTLRKIQDNHLCS